MYKRSSFDIKRKVLFFLKKEDLTYAQLERKVNTGFRTIKLNCAELQNYGLIQIQEIGKHPSNGKVYFLIKITQRGLDFLKQ